MKNKLIKWGTILVCVLFIVLILFIIFSKNNDTTPTDNINTETSSGTEQQHPTGPNLDPSINGGSENNNNNSSDNKTDDNNSEDSDGQESNVQTPSGEEEEKYWENDDPNKTVVEWDQIKYPVTRMQHIIDDISQANAVLNQKTGEDIFDMKTETISSRGMVTYVSEYGRKVLFEHKVEKQGNGEVVSYPDEVIFGFALFIGGNVKPDEIGDITVDPSLWRNSASKTIHYHYPTEKPAVVNTFEVISCKQTGGTLDLMCEGKGKYAGHRYNVSLYEQFTDLWAVLGVTQID